MGSATILIVEDEAIVAADLAGKLGQLGYEISGTSGYGEDAVRQARERRPDLVLMDIKLAGAMDGVEAAEIMHREFDLPVIFLTAHSDRATLDRAKITEPFGYMLKPFDDHGLETHIEMALYKHRAEAEKKRLEARNRQLQKAESLGRMAGAIAHHFNNKLHVVMGHLSLVMATLPAGNTSRNNLNSALQAANEAAEVSRSMLTYLGRATGELEPLDLSDICKKSLESIQSTVPEDVALETDFPSPGPTITADLNQVHLILANLINNSLEAIGTDQGTLHLSVKKVVATEISQIHRFPVNQKPDAVPYACLEIEDSGCGMTAKDIEEAFDPFFSTKFVGRGLGLSVVLGIVQAHRGFVTVESAADRGSVFKVFFPASARKLPLQPEETDNAKETLNGGTVLLIDDDRIALEITGMMLTNLGFSVLKAMDGVEAVEVFRRYRDEIRLVVSDVAMPRMNGLETVSVLRHISPGIPIIFASGYSEEQVMDRTHPGQSAPFLEKPFGIEKLQDAIQESLSSKVS